MRFASIKTNRVTPKLFSFDTDEHIAKQVVGHLERHDHFRYHLDSLCFNFHSGRLTVTGKLPSFYLKQMLQTILLSMPEIRHLDNSVDVIARRGISSVRNSADEGTQQ